jgi:carboxymethylenebutenolidase
VETQVQMVSVEGERGRLDAYLVRPPRAASPRPGIVVVQEVFGLTSDLRRTCDRFARQGYVTLAVNLYTGLKHPDPDRYDLEGARGVMASLADRAILRGLHGGIDFLQRDSQVGAGTPEGPRRVGAIGFCIGGALAMMLASSTGKLSAAVNCYGRVFYPQVNDLKPRHPIDYVERLGCPMLGVFGQEDDLIPPGDIERLRQALRAAEKEFELIVYPRAGHAFLNEDRPTFRPEVAREAWGAIDSFFARHLQTGEAATPRRA